MRLRPRRLNAAIATLFMIGSAGFAVGSVPAYASAVGATADAVTFFVSSLFFTTASFWQLVQSQSPETAATGTAHDDERQRVRLLAWLPRDRSWLAAATQFPGTLFFNGTTLWAITTRRRPASTTRSCGGRTPRLDPVPRLEHVRGAGRRAVLLLAAARRRVAHRVAQHVGSIAFMASAVGAYVLPSTGEAIDATLADKGTFAGRRLLLPRRPAGDPGMEARRRRQRRRGVGDGVAPLR